MAWVISVTGGCGGEGGLKDKDGRLGMVEGSKVVSSAVLGVGENGFLQRPVEAMTQLQRRIVKAEWKQAFLS